MRFFAVLCLAFLFQNSYCQTDSLKYITWEQAQNLPIEDILYLDCSKLKWKEIPKNMSKFKFLRKINLSKNKISSLPLFFSDFTQLEEIFLGKNEFKEIPNVVFSIKNLKKISFYKNKITIIDDNICLLNKLEYIDFWDNSIPILPECIVNLSKLKEVHLEGIAYSEKFQEKWANKMPNTKFYFDKPCSCKD